MNLIVSSQSMLHLPGLNSLPGNPLRSHSHPHRATPSTPAFPNQSSAGTWPRTHKARTEWKETHHRYQKECQSGTIGSFYTYLLYSNHHKHQLSQNACKVMAKDLVRTRRYVQKFYQMRTQLQAVSLRIQTLRSNQQMADAMRGATRVSSRKPWLIWYIHAYRKLGHGFNEPWS